MKEKEMRRRVAMLERERDIVKRKERTRERIRGSEGGYSRKGGKKGGEEGHKRETRKQERWEMVDSRVGKTKI